MKCGLFGAIIVSVLLVLPVSMALDWEEIELEVTSPTADKIIYDGGFHGEQVYFRDIISVYIKCSYLERNYWDDYKIRVICSDGDKEEVKEQTLLGRPSSSYESVVDFAHNYKDSPKSYVITAQLYLEGELLISQERSIAPDYKDIPVERLRSLIEA